jgi:hypothetical protein
VGLRGGDAGDTGNAGDAGDDGGDDSGCDDVNESITNIHCRMRDI